MARRTRFGGPLCVEFEPCASMGDGYGSVSGPRIGVGMLRGGERLVSNEYEMHAGLAARRRSEGDYEAGVREVVYTVCWSRRQALGPGGYEMPAKVRARRKMSGRCGAEGRGDGMFSGFDGGRKRETPHMEEWRSGRELSRADAESPGFFRRPGLNSDQRIRHVD